MFDVGREERASRDLHYDGDLQRWKEYVMTRHLWVYRVGLSSRGVLIANRYGSLAEYRLGELSRALAASTAAQQRLAEVTAERDTYVPLAHSPS